MSASEDSSLFKTTDFQRKDAAQHYSFFEQVTRVAADALVTRAKVLSVPNLVVFDNAAGTGAVASVIYEQAGGKEVDVLCGDLSPVMVQSVNERIAKEGWKGAKTQIVDAMVRLAHASLENSFIMLLFFRTPNCPASTSHTFLLVLSSSLFQRD